MSVEGNTDLNALRSIQPVIQTAIGDNFNIVTSQQGRICGFFEAQFYKCMEAFGQKLGRLYCDLENRDYYECMTHEKMRKRFEAIRMERYKQWLEGKLETPFPKEHIKVGQFAGDYYDHVNINPY